MLNLLSYDLLWYISDFLNIEDTLKISSINPKDNLFIIYYTPYVNKIKKWYTKYKNKRNIRYLTLLNQFQNFNKKMYNAYFSNIFFNLYNLKKLKKFLKEYHFYSLLKYFFKNSSNETEILELYQLTINNMTYSNLKKFLKKLPVKLLLRM
jgi:hypothetical protein